MKYRQDTLAEIDVRHSKNSPEWDMLIVRGVDFVIKLFYNNKENKLYDHAYNKIRKSPNKFLSYDVYKVRVYGINSIKPYKLTVGRFDNGQWTANYSL